MDERLDFLFLNEKEAIQAGANDMARCVDVMDEVFQLLGQGDYLMGCPNHNAHGIKIYFPKETPFPRMPVKGPDRRFMALVAYLGGRYHVCGEKWYGSNLANREQGLPRSILTTVLNNADTGAPIAILSANALSSTRTGAIPAVGAKYCARKDSSVLGVIGVGVIGRACLQGLMCVLPNIKTVKVYDLDQKAAQDTCGQVEKDYPGVRAVAVPSVEEAVRDSDVVNVATSGAVSPEIKEEWLKEGVLLTLPASAALSKHVMQTSTILVDDWKMYEAYAQELRDEPGGFAANLSGICGYMMDLERDGEIRREDIVDLGDVVMGKRPGRTSDQERIIFIMDGMPIEDVAWGYTVYEKAKELGLGTKLNLWG